MIRAGRRSGKTTGSAGLAVERLLGPDGTNRVLYAVPTADQIARFWHEVCLALAPSIEDGALRKYESDKIIEKPGTEQRIRAKTAWNADTLRGDYGDLIILDEYQLMNEDALQDVVYPMLIDNNGDLVLIYTPPSLHSRSMSKATDKRHAAKLFKKNQSNPRWLCLHFTSHDNPFVSEEGIAEVSRDMSALAIQQEIEAIDVDEVPGALWKLQEIEDDRVDEIPASALPLVRIVVAIDPTGSTTNEAGIVAAAKGSDDHGYLLSDDSLLNVTPRLWAQKAVWRYHELKADRIIGEENYGGDMVREVIETVDTDVAYKSVNATRGKLVRAEPIHAMYEKHRIHHVGRFPALEEECVSYVPGVTKVSPNRMDAMVWAFTELFPQGFHYAVLDSAKREAEDARQKRQQAIPSQPGDASTGQPIPQCPACGSSAIVRRGRVLHCNQCGEEQNVGKPPDVIDEGDRKQRADIFR